MIGVQHVGHLGVCRDVSQHTHYDRSWGSECISVLSTNRITVITKWCADWNVLLEFDLFNSQCDCTFTLQNTLSHDVYVITSRVHAVYNCRTYLYEQYWLTLMYIYHTSQSTRYLQALCLVVFVPWKVSNHQPNVTVCYLCWGLKRNWMYWM